MIRFINNYDEYLEALPYIDNINSPKHYMQDYEWFILKYGKHGVEKFSILGYDNNEIIYYCNIFIKTNKKMAYAPRGPILDFNNEKHVNIFVSDIKKFLLDINCEKFTMSPMLFKCNDPNIKQIKNHYNEQEHSKKECIVCIEPYDTSPMENVDKKCAYAFRKSLKSGFSVNISKNIDNLNEFYKLYIKTSEKHQFNRNTLTYFKTLADCFKDSIYAITILNKDAIISYGLYIWKYDTLYYLYGATDYSYSSQKASYFMHYNAMSFCKNNKIKYFNMGGVYADDNEIESKDFGLLRYKKSFCKNKFTYYIGDLMIIP